MLETNRMDINSEGYRDPTAIEIRRQARRMKIYVVRNVEKKRKRLKSSATSSRQSRGLQSLQVLKLSDE